MGERKTLTPRQQEILAFIEHYAKRHGVPPSIRDIAEQFGIYPRAAYDHLRALERKGIIIRTPHKSRSVQVAKNRPRIPEANGVPVPIVGRIAAGTPILAVENLTGELMIDTDLFKGHDYFAVRVQGDSMIEDHILEGDYVILRIQSTADPGDVVAALIEEDVTLKHFYPRGEEIELRPANHRLQPLRYPAETVRILGKMVGLIRKA